RHAGQCRTHQGLSSGARHRGADHRRLYRHQSVHRPAVWPDRPADIAHMSAAAAAPREASRFAKLFASPGAVAGMAVLLVMVTGAILAPLVVPFDWNETRVCVR